MFYTETVSVKARKPHTCTYCCEDIEKGEVYETWRSVGDAGWFTNKMHAECCNDFNEEGDGEYCPYSNCRPVVPLQTGG